MRRIFIVTMFFMIFANPAQALRVCQEEEGKEDESVVRIGVLYRQVANDESLKFEGNQLWSVMQAVEKVGRDVCVIGFPYPTEANGYRLLASIRNEGKVHFVIGPTDTGVYADALRDAESFSSKHMVMISPIVTASAREEPAGWIFKTNLNVDGRAQAVMDLLRQLNVDSIGIVYEDSKFGLDAEAAMRRAAADITDYRAVRYKLQPDLSTAVEMMMRDRPAVIGILSSRKDFATIMNTIEDKKKHRINPYHPIVFSLIDIRSLGVPDVNFVSVGNLKTDEIETLSRTTLLSVLAVIEGIPTTPEMQPGSQAFAESLRDGIAGILERSPLGSHGARPSVFRLDKGKLVDVRDKIEDYGFFDRLFLPAKNLVRRFGNMPYLNIATIVFLVTIMSWQDLRKWNDERVLSFRTRRKMTKVVVFNSVMALIVYFFMLSVGLIEWSSWTAAIVVGCGYPALLKSTLMQTPLGESLGAADHYDKYLHRLNDEIMEAQYRGKKSIIDYIAMTNSPSKMRETLESIYGHASPKRKMELKAELDAALALTKDSIDQRTELAKRLNRRYEQQELVDLGFLPNFELDKIVGPNEILQAGLEYCCAGTNQLERLEDEFERRIGSIRNRHPERADSDEAEVKEWIARAQTERGDMRGYLRWFFMKENFNIRKLISLNFLPDDADKWDKQQWKAYATSAEVEMRVEEAEQASDTPVS